MNPHEKGTAAYDWWEFHQAVGAFLDAVRTPVLAMLEWFLRHPTVLVVWILVVVALIVATSRP